MANIEHVDISDPDIHEPKGVAAATADKVYVSDGAGSGAWTAVASLLGTDTFLNMAIWTDEKTAGTAGGTFTSGSWTTRTLNTQNYNNITGASLSTNTITLPNGTYYIEASAPALVAGLHKARFRNTSDGTTVVVGTAEDSAVASQTRSIVSGRFTVSGGPKNFQLQHRCSVTASGGGLGAASSFDEVEVYSQVVLWKVA